MSSSENFGIMTSKQLIEECKKRGIRGYSNKTKQELLNLLSRSNQIESVSNSSLMGGSSSDYHLKLVDLFAGTGAFSYAFLETGHVDVVFANDMMESSKKIYDSNFGHQLELKDLHDVDVEDIPVHDILTAGFPCQPFSIAGKQQGFDDQRSNVFWKILEIVDYHQPRCIILENVKNLLTHDNNNTFNTIREELENRDYHINYKVLNTADITGVPQHRERIYIVCFKDEDLAEDFSFDLPKIPKRSIKDFLQEQVPSKYYYKETSAIWNMLDENVVNDDTVYQYRRVYVRENKSKECPTLTANMGEGGHNVPIILDENGIRKLTPRECFNFQGFPDTYQIPKELSDCKLYKLAGNAVSLPVVKLLANKIVPMLL